MMEIKERSESGNKREFAETLTIFFLEPVCWFSQLEKSEKEQVKLEGSGMNYGKF